MTGPARTPWPEAMPPADEALEAILRREGLQPRWWSNGPGDSYGPHRHPYHKVLYCARGSIRFTAGEAGEPFDLSPSDRLDLPPGTLHSALVGRQGVACVEAARG